MEVGGIWLLLLGLPWLLLAALVASEVAAAARRPKPLGLPGKYSVEVDGDFVVFVIGLYRHPGAWLWQWRTAIRTSLAMFAMVRELEQHPEYGCLVVRPTEAFLLNPTRQLLIWRSYEDLAAYARNHMAKHLGTWMQWDKTARGFAGSEIPGIGIYHETFLVKAGAYEAVYRNMPRSGLAEIGRIVDASHGRMRSGKGRLGQTDGGDHADIAY